MATDVVTRARSLLGVRFRLHGRDPAYGVDCVGLVALATQTAAPNGYRRRDCDDQRWCAELDCHFRRRTSAVAAAGDIVLLAPAPTQRHLGIWSGTGMIHADSGLGYVVETPGAPRWPIIAIWQTGAA